MELLFDWACAPGLMFIVHDNEKRKNTPKVAMLINIMGDCE